MKNCRKCGVELIPHETITPSRLKHSNYICNKCNYSLYKEYFKKARKKNYLKNREKYLEDHKKYYKEKREERLKYFMDHREHSLELQRKRQKEYKIKVINHYSNGTMACVNPFGEHKEPYTTIEALSIDHINGGGTQHRKKHGKYSSYYWFIKNEFPEGYQVLCMNCQFIKRIRNNELGGIKK